MKLAGPAAMMEVLLPTNLPAPMIPPMEIMVKWRPLSERLSSCGWLICTPSVEKTKEGSWADCGDTVRIARWSVAVRIGSCQRHVDESEHQQRERRQNHGVIDIPRIVRAARPAHVDDRADA